MTLKFNKSLIIKTTFIAIIVMCMFQQQIFDGTSKKESFELTTNIALGSPTKSELITKGDFTLANAYNYSEIGNWTDSSTVQKVVVVEDHAFVADGINGFTILDISDKTNITEVYRRDTSDDVCYDVVVKDDRAYVAWGARGFVIFNIVNYGLSYIVGETNSFLIDSNETVALDITSNYAYLACEGQGLVILAISEEDNPSYLGNYRNGGIARDVNYVSDSGYEFVFMTMSFGAESGLYTIDVSNPISPNFEGKDTTHLSDPYGLQIEFKGTRRFAYIADKTMGFVILGLFNPASPALLDSHLIYNYKSIYYGGQFNYTFLVSETQGFVMYNTTFIQENSEIDGIIGKYNDGGAANSIIVDSGYCYIADGAAGLEILELDNDSDLLYDGDEIEIYGTDPYDDDTDDDELDDYKELIIYNTNATKADTDDDLLFDGEEVIAGTDGFITDPLNNDTDSDLISDGNEVLGLYYDTSINKNATGYIFTDPLDPDFDDDYLKDGSEYYGYGTDPTFNDTDFDTMLDFWEVTNGLDPLSDDTLDDYDTDGLINIDEYNRGTQPDLADTDADGLEDGEEVHGVYCPTNPYANETDYIRTDKPLQSDADFDGLKDGYEVFTSLTDPLDSDSDDDSLLDGQEVNTWSTNPSDEDTDADGMDDYWESLYYDSGDGTLPTSDDADVDIDHDGLTNLEEYNLNTNPIVADSDEDGMNDGWEVQYGLNPLKKDGGGDLDSDRLSNLKEFQIGTDPTTNDTDGDGMDDYWEDLMEDPDDIYEGPKATVADADLDLEDDGLTNLEEYLAETDPCDPDSDNDGLIDGLEVNTYGTDPNLWDSDGDGESDGDEIEANTDPLNPKSNSERRTKVIALSIGLSVSIGLVIFLVAFFGFYWLSRPEQKMFRYLSKRKSQGELSLSLKEITEYLDKKLNRGEVKQLINEYSDSKNLILEGNRVWLTDKEELIEKLERFQEELDLLKEQSSPNQKAVQSLIENIEYYNKAVKKLRFTDFDSDYDILLKEANELIEKIPEETEIDIEEPTSEEPETSASTFSLPEIDSKPEEQDDE